MSVYVLVYAKPLKCHQHCGTVDEGEGEHLLTVLKDGRGVVEVVKLKCSEQARFKLH